MASMLLQLNVCVMVAFIHLTSSQSTYDAVHQHNDAGSCGLAEQMIDQLMTVNSQLMNDASQLQRDVAKLKTGSQRKNMRDR